MNNMNNLLDKFLEFEKKEQLFKYNQNGHSIWPFLRLEVYRFLTMDKNGDAYLPVYKRQVLNNSFSNENYNTLCKLSSNKDVLLFTSKHRLLPSFSGLICPHEEMLKTTGLNYYRINLLFDENKAHDAHDLCFKSSDNDKFFDLINDKIASKILNLIIEEFDIDRLDNFVIRYNSMVQYICDLSKQYYGLKQFLSETKPKIIALSSAYSIPGIFITLAAHELDIKVVEFQHGLIDCSHIAYNSLCADINKNYYPDCLFTYGVFDCCFPRHIIPKVIAIGNYYLEMCKKRYYKSKSNIILIVDDIDNPELIFKLAYRLYKAKINDKFEVIYRLHPESPLPKNKINDLEKINIRISYNDENIYELLSKSKWVVGIRSTVLIEALYFECNSRTLENENVNNIAFKLLKKVNCSQLINEVNQNINIDETNISNLFYTKFNSSSLLEQLEML